MVRTLGTTFTATVALAALATTARAGEIAIGIADGNGGTALPELVVFDTDAPDILLVERPLRGLGAFERVAGLDLRTVSGELWLLTELGRWMLLDAATGQLSHVGDLLVNPPFSPSSPGEVDFNPAVDRLRLVNVARHNARFNPVTVEPVDTDSGTPGFQGDTALAYIGTDPNAGSLANVVAIAYDRNDNDGATATTLFGIDAALSNLVRHGAVDGNGADIAGGGNPNGGLLTTIGPIGVPPGERTAFDIAAGSTPVAAGGRGLAFMVTQVGADASSTLFTIDLDTGAGTAVGVIPVGPMTGFAVLLGGGFDVPAEPTRLDESAGEATIAVTRRGGTLAPALVAFHTVDRSALGGIDYTPAMGLLVFEAGQASAEVTVSILADDEPEPAETFGLVLGPTSDGSVVLVGDHTIEIAADDAGDSADAGPDGDGDGDGGCGCRVRGGAGSLGSAALVIAALVAMFSRRRSREARASRRR